MSAKGQGGHQFRPEKDSLTPREKEVLQHIFMGERNKVIAQKMGIVERSLTNYIQRIHAKLGISCDRELIPLVIMARREGRE